MLIYVGPYKVVGDQLNLVVLWSPIIFIFSNSAIDLGQLVCNIKRLCTFLDQIYIY